MSVHNVGYKAALQWTTFTMVGNSYTYVCRPKFGGVARACIYTILLGIKWIEMVLQSGSLRRNIQCLSVCMEFCVMPKSFNHYMHLWSNNSRCIWKAYFVFHRCQEIIQNSMINREKYSNNYFQCRSKGLFLLTKVAKQLLSLGHPKVISSTENYSPIRILRCAGDLCMEIDT